MSHDPASTPPGDLDPAFEALVRAHYGRLYGVAFSYLRSADAADDAVQDALFKSWRQRMAIDLSDPLPYLFRAVRNECISALRRRGRWRQVELDPNASTTGRAADPGGLEAEELEAAVRQAVDELPERCRLVFLLSREQHLSYSQIASTMGISIKTVEAQMGKALRVLRPRLAQFLSVTLPALLSGGFFAR
jgi:RNA polymerase sigma-70 factor, ECF subfamily